MADLNDMELRRRVLRCGLLSAASLLCLVAVRPAGAQEADASPPVQSPDDYVPPGPGAAAEPNAVATKAVTAAETVLPPKSPDYFETLYPHYMKAPLPARGCRQRAVG